MIYCCYLAVMKETLIDHPKSRFLEQERQRRDLHVKGTTSTVPQLGQVCLWKPL